MTDSPNPATDTFELTWRNKYLTIDATSLPEMADMLHKAADELTEMASLGVVLDPNGSVQDDYAELVTNDPTVAVQYGFDKAEPDVDALYDEDDGLDDLVSAVEPVVA